MTSNRKLEALLIEDDEGMADFITDELSDRGYAVKHFRTTKEGLSELEKQGDRYCLVVTDYNHFPNGVAVARRALQLKQRPQVYIISANDSHEVKAEMLQLMQQLLKSLNSQTAKLEQTEQPFTVYMIKEAGYKLGYLHKTDAFQHIGKIADKLKQEINP